MLIDSYGSINKDIQVAGLPDGGFVVAYTDDGWGLSGTEITARVYNADGSARSGYLLVNDSANGGKTAGDQALSSLVVLPNGHFAVGWSTPATNLEYLQAYDAQGNALGPNKLVMGNVVEAEISRVSAAAKSRCWRKAWCPTAAAARSAPRSMSSSALSMVTEPAKSFTRPKMGWRRPSTARRRRHCGVLAQLQ